MDNIKLAAIMYIAAGVLFAVTGILGGNILILPVGAVLVVLGVRKLKQHQQDQNNDPDEAW